MRQETCPVCRSIDLKNKNTAHTSVLNNNKLRYELYLCKKCELEFWSPFEVLPAFYQSGLPISEFSNKGGEDPPEHTQIFFKSTENMLYNNLLDVGCGDGAFLRKIQKTGIHVVGIDFDNRNAEINQSNGFEIIHGNAIDILNTVGESVKFDVITLFETLEHLDKPNEMLRAIKKNLKPGGVLFGTVPNSNRMLKKIDYVYYDFPPAHLTRWTESSIRNILKMNGYAIDTIGLNGSDSFVEFNRKFMSIILRNLFDKMFFFKRRNHPLDGFDEISKQVDASSLYFIKRVFKFSLQVIFIPLSALLFPFYLQRREGLFFLAINEENNE